MHRVVQTVITFLPFLMSTALTLSAQTIRILAVTDAATFAPGLPYSGSLASIFCTGLTAISGIQSASTLPLPYQLVGVSVTVNGADAPLLAVADLGGYHQINIQVPRLQDSPQIIEVSQFGLTGQLEWQRPANWGVFFTDQTGYAVAQHVDYSLVTPDHPAHPGEVVVVYATNLDSFAFVTNAPDIGYPTEADTLPALFPSRVGNALRIAPFLTVNGQEAKILYSGMTPGSVGVFQINFRLPEATPEGDALLEAARGTCFPIGGCSTISYEYSRAAKMPVRTIRVSLDEITQGRLER